MTEQSGETARDKTAAPRKPRRGPRKEADIRAEVEAELRAEMERQRTEIEAQVRAEVERERAEAERSALDDKPITGFDISDSPATEGSVTIHFVEDGFTVLGKVWYRGEELTLVPGSDQWEQAPDYRDKKFALLNEFEQEEIWGRRFFRNGPWRGKSLTEIDDPELTEEDRAVLAQAEKIRNERYGVAPQRS